jgi:S1-C subfamily serine protease
VYGHPRGRPAVEISPAQVLRRATVDAGDIYDRPSTPRQILVLGADLEPGDSGAALVNSAGKVVGVAFAVSNLRRGTAFAVASEELAPVLAKPRSGALRAAGKAGSPSAVPFSPAADGAALRRRRRPPAFDRQLRLSLSYGVPSTSWSSPRGRKCLPSVSSCCW